MSSSKLPTESVIFTRSEVSFIGQSQPLRSSSTYSILTTSCLRSLLPSRSDIKPENILFERIPILPSRHPVHRQYDEEKEDEGEFQVGVGGGGIGRVKIADFGLSKVVWETNTATPCGTVGYTAPEIVKDERYSKSVDMWALGCVLYTLLCGFPYVSFCPSCLLLISFSC
jgi:serine/threonine protein kinase